jgi:hypothetical protein
VPKASSRVADFVDIVTPGNVGGSLALLGFFVKLWWDDREKKKAALEAKLEAGVETEARAVEVKLDKIVDGQARMELELRDMRNALATQAGTVDQVDRRVQGLSSDYGPRIKALELWQAEQMALDRRTRGKPSR